MAWLWLLLLYLENSPVSSFERRTKDQSAQLSNEGKKILARASFYVAFAPCLVVRQN